MAAPISPGVYTTITDLSTYVGAVPSTIGFICSLTEKGEDNVLKFFASRADYIAECGQPNIQTYGKNYGQGPYCAYNYLGESGSLFHMRCLPVDAAFANIKIEADRGVADATATIQVSYIDSTTANTMDELRTALAQSGDLYPIAVLYPTGRGEFYNSIGVRFIEHENPMLEEVYTLDIYEKQSDGSEVIVESFEVSFDPKATDTSGDSIWIQYILNSYSTILNCEMTTDGDDTYTSGYDMVVRVFDKDIGDVDIVETAGSATLTDIKQDFADWATASATYEYVVQIKDQRGNILEGWLGAVDAGASNNDTVMIYDGRLAGASQNWIGNLSDFDDTGEITYIIRKSLSKISAAFTSDVPVPLKKGSDGSLLDTAGDLNTTEAENLLVEGYSGQLVSKEDGDSLIDDVVDTENIYISAVFDCGYTSNVKSAISTLVQTRRDCVAIMDNGDNTSANAALTKRNTTNTMNNYFCALYEPYNKVYDSFTAQDVFFSPIYHLAYLLPRNDNVSEVWYAVAGFNRAAIDTIKELRYNAKLSQRDQMYLKQLNPIVKFNPGYTVWGQLTTQAKVSAMQDLNIVRLVLYCKRALEEYCRYFIFEQNDAITWSQVSGDIALFLDDIRTRRGLYSYEIDVGATEYESKTKTFHVDVTLEPTRVVEKIALNFSIT